MLAQLSILARLRQLRASAAPEATETIGTSLAGHPAIADAPAPHTGPPESRLREELRNGLYLALGVASAALARSCRRRAKIDN